MNLALNELCGLDWRGEGTYTAEGITAIADALRVNGSLTTVWSPAQEPSTHHFATYYVMNSLFMFNSIESQTFAIVLHAVSYVPLVIIGSYYFFKSSIQIFDVFNKELIDEKV